MAESKRGGEGAKGTSSGGAAMGTTGAEKLLTSPSPKPEGTKGPASVKSAEGGGGK